MFRSSVAAFRGLAIVLALVLGLSAAPQAFAAQGDPDEIPEGLIAGSSVTYVNEEQDFSTLLFNVLAFEDEGAAATGLDFIVDATTASLDDVAVSGEEDGTPAAELEVTELTDVEGLDELGDEARAYEIPFGEGVNVAILLVRDGLNVHYWSYITTDLSSLDGSEATPAATPTAEALIDVLLGIATPWFEDGIDPDAELIDQLPTIDELPDGYTESDRQESIDLGV
ncbi:MAG: hypothetical protein AVDCRST_MAG33-821 [uncultured Thermomicrobiales bacterium]|uniref:Uncharacterized protein n=1 Tax=uncultured Thermomicrobiales bacterium TaxID=1645740 RepID=A0A6J4UH53_9BACT|nr:MAG: hypothetical protein AVDCRST_MAG33-821 [uncultured Thermomicrobiales bacterium]